MLKSRHQVQQKKQSIASKSKTMKHEQNQNREKVLTSSGISTI